MSTEITFEKVIKKYGDNTVIPALSLRVQPSEFFTLLGPSGCGKTTLLRMVAGFNSIEGGEICFNKKAINASSPQDRNIGMVFQNYAIFPHLTVKKNITFGLENRKIKLSKADIEKKVATMMDVVQISQFKDRLPENLSGGQQQRIALARAIVIEPSVLLMDEPLSNLDAKLRVDMRNAIRDIQKEVGITTLYVTHDQEEAMAVSDRIAVMNLGEIQHVGTPQNIYHRPANVFVANFIGRTNIIERELQFNGEIATLVFDDNHRVVLNSLDTTNYETRTVKISIRPEEFIIAENNEGIRGQVLNNMFLGLNTHYNVQLVDGEHVEIIQESTIGQIIEPGTWVGLKIKTDKINVFEYESELSITKGVVNNVQ
ncbi:ABC transporter ATP-binding protein [Brochothrix thermosphacta]|uniref:ABC transporter ATP-binding protein n=1 Tax=Brochothrix thermosphacta TaxID=2756 RepID=UPI00265CBEB2|nr:ABC transporter ATP-binding protein [Brochothrix thermosphacta]WKK68718.1 ABC transporter ATP-binding protein [Brochothrix thermosphacta]